MENFDKAIEILNKHNYRIVAKAYDHGCVVEFPEGISSLTKMSQFYDEETSLMTITYDYGENISQSYDFKCEPYVCRPFMILCNMLLKCNEIGYNMVAIKYMMGDTEEGSSQDFYDSMFYYCLDDEQVNKEMLLGAAAVDMLDGISPDSCRKTCEQMEPNICEGLEHVIKLIEGKYA